MKKIIFFCLTALMLCSCGAYKRLAYMQDMVPMETYDITQKANPRIAIGDELSITVSSSFPQLVAPFNVTSATTTFDVVTQVESFKNVGNGSCVYQVDKEGKIDFPVLGSIYVEGMTPEDLKNLIETSIKSKDYVKDPSVTVTFSNFTVYVLGEISKKGTLNVPSGGLNVLQALAQSGDMTDDAMRDKLWVIRSTGDTRRVYTLNMKSRTFFDSPAFYLQQGDIIYVAPKDNKMDKSSSNRNTYITLVLSVISTLATLILWTRIYRQ